MSFLQNLFAAQKQRSLDKRLIFCREIDWTIQLPIQFAMVDLVKAQKTYEFSSQLMGSAVKGSIYHDTVAKVIFSSNYDHLNHFSAAIVNIKGFSPDQIQISRTDCDDRLFSLYSRIPNSTVHRTISTIDIGGRRFNQYAYLVRKSGKPIFCFEYSSQSIGDYELSISMNYNNETQRQTMAESLTLSKFGH